MELAGGFEGYPLVTNALIEHNQFVFEGANASAVLINLNGCDGVVVHGNDFGRAGGGDAKGHLKASRCTNCTVDGAANSSPSPSPSLTRMDCADITAFGALVEIALCVCLGGW